MRKTALAALWLLSSIAQAQVETIINFRGQNGETIELNKAVNVTRPQAYQYQDTCTREIPYESYECENVTRYRQECSWVPASQNCWEEPDQVCRSVTRYRQECTRGPSRRECRENPPRQVCRDNPGREVCIDVPSREVCVERPTREVCRTNSQGQQVCQTVGGGQSCQTVGGGRTCHTEGGGQTCTTVPGGQTCEDVSGPDICRDVAYADQECQTVSRTRCETIPAHNDCRDIPYSEQVCGNVTRYNTERYSCTQTGYRDVTVVKTLKGKIDVSFSTNGVVEEFPLSVVVSAKTAAHQDFTLSSVLKREPRVLVAAQKRKLTVVNETDREIVLAGSMTIETLDPALANVAFPAALKNATISDDQILTVDIEGSLSAQGKIDLELIHNKLIGKDQKIGELRAAYPSDKVKIEGSKLVVNLAGVVQKLEKKMSLNVKLGAELPLRGEILNATKPQTEKSYAKLKVTKR